MLRSGATVVGLAAAAALAACSDPQTPVERADGRDAAMNVRQVIGIDNPGPPFYSLIQPGWFPMTDKWAAIPWLRDTNCVPADFNILGLVDLTILFPPEVPFPGPRPFFCPLTIGGHEIWNTDPPNPAVGPLNVTAYGLGAVPIWFVSTAELLPALDDGVLTITELAAMSSLLIGHADHFSLTQQTGIARGRPGEGKINITARGTLEDGRSFFFQTAEGPPKKDEIAHTRITFR
jgi:hypothetical protein